ncbi:MAG TPA: hypothetical protein VK168_18800 [Saprospiraceae bacterium]|nr:hypothetical protein [Saprospiraceae bacterium]
MKKSLFYIALFGLMICLMPADADAQCAMCKGAAEANLKQGGGDPKGLNNGILYMLAIPYLLVGTIGYWWWRNRVQEREQAADLTEEDFARYE